MGKQAKEIVNHLQLQEHPEGGWYKEVYRSDMVLNQKALPHTFTADKSALTSIYYLLANAQYSAFHKIKSPEVWFFHKGMPLVIHMISEKGTYSKVELSDKAQGHLQYTVEPNTWFAAEIKGQYGYSLVSCAVAPGFDFSDFTLAQSTDLRSEYSEHVEIIERLCK
ncbi:cupin domain-containing protein [Labilibacter sediminis]|nr:cupin domain-containing protein [Labilibacter sediminis]